MAAYWVWSNRMGLLEKFAIDTLSEEGVQAELSWDELSKTHLVLSNVRLSYDGERFFSSDKIRAEYQWRDLLDGLVERLEFTRPDATLTLNEDWQIVDGWLPPGMGAGGGGNSAFPPRGISVTDGQFTLNTVYGPADVTASADIQDLENLTTEVELAPTTWTRDELSADISGQSKITIDKGIITAEGALDIPTLRHPSVDASGLYVKFNGIPDLTKDQRQFAGDINLSFDSLDMAQAELTGTALSWSGRAAEADIGVDLDGRWQADIEALRLPDPVRNRNLAQSLSLTPALSRTPVAQHFVPDLEAQLLDLFTQSAISAKGALRRDEAGVRIELAGPATIRARKTVLTLSPRRDEAVYQFDRDARQISAYFDGALTQPAGLTVKNGRFVAKSFNGWRIDGVETFRALVSTTSTWRNAASPARLGPIKIQTDYDGRSFAHRKVKLSGAVDYDGPLPGGIVEGLQTTGQMDVHLRPDHLAVDFTPSSGEIRASKVETATDWTITDFTGKAAKAAPIYERKGEVATILSELSDVSMTATRSSDGATLGIVSRDITLKGTLANTANGLQQDWDGVFQAAIVKSDDIPGPNTLINLGNGNLSAKLLPSEPLSFALKAPTAQIRSPLIQAKNIGLDVSGTPDNYTLNHENGLVKLTANDLPPMPLKGSVKFQDGVFKGQTVAYLPQANNTPINIDYQIKDSAGTATVDIEALRFRPNGLQPQSLVPALRGKVARVDGSVSAKINLAFAAGQPMKSSGTAKLNNINFGTAPGPLTGVSTEVDLESVLPLKTRGRQTMTVDMFDPGLPLANGVIEYELMPEGVKVYSARWPLGDGFFSLDPFTWKYAAQENRMTLRLEKVDLGAFINNLGNGALKATGDLEGAFPIVIRGINVTVEDGLIRVPNGGRIQYAAAEADATKEVNRFAGAAMEALKDFRYQELFAKVNGPLDGEILVGMKFEGKNEKVLSGQPFAFDVTIEGELFNILRNFNSNEHIKSSVARQTGKAVIE